MTGTLERWRELVATRWRTGATVFAVATLIGVAAVFLPRPVYRAEARVRIGEPPPSTGVSPTASVLGFFRPGGDPFANDLELLASRTVTEDLVLDEALAVEARAPRGWYRDSLFTRLTADTGTRKATFDVRWVTPDSVAVRMVDPADSDLGGATVGEPYRFGGVTAVFRPRRPGGPAHITVRTVTFAEAVRRAAHRVDANRTRAEANVVEMQADGTDPVLTQSIVGDAIASFIRLRAALQEHESNQTVDSMRRVVDSARTDLDRAEGDLADWERRSGLVAPDAQATAFFKRYGEVAAALTEAESARREVARAFAFGTDGSGTDGSDAPRWESVVGAPALMENATVADLANHMAALEQERQALALRRRPDDRAYRDLEAQIASADSSLSGLVAGYRTALDRRIETLRAEKSSMDSAVRALPAASVERARRERSVRVLAEVVSLAEERLRQEQLRTALTFANVQVIDPPALRARPVWPRKKLGLVGTLLCATGLGALAIVLRDRSDRTVRRESDLVAALGAPLLATLRSDSVGDWTLVDGTAAIVPPDPARIALVDAGEPAIADDSAPALRAAGVPVAAVGRVDRFPAARELMSRADAVLVVAEYGRTLTRDVERAGRLVRAAGGRVLGVLIACRSDADIRRVWRT